MSKIDFSYNGKLNMTAEESFKHWFDSKFDEEYKNGVASAIRKGLTVLRDRAVSNVNSSGFRNTTELSKGVVMSVDQDYSEGKVHILGSKGKGGFLRIFELGTYKSPDHKPQIKARNWFTSAVSEVGAEVEQRTLDALQKLIDKRFRE